MTSMWYFSAAMNLIPIALWSRKLINGSNVGPAILVVVLCSANVAVCVLRGREASGRKRRIRDLRKSIRDLEDNDG